MSLLHMKATIGRFCGRGGQSLLTGALAKKRIEDDFASRLPWWRKRKKHSLWCHAIQPGACSQSAALPMAPFQCCVKHSRTYFVLFSRRDLQMHHQASHLSSTCVLHQHQVVQLDGEPDYELKESRFQTGCFPPYLVTYLQFAYF